MQMAVWWALCRTEKKKAIFVFLCVLERQQELIQGLRGKKREEESEKSKEKEENRRGQHLLKMQ